MNAQRILWPARDLREATGGAFAQSFDAAGIAIDSRTLAAGDVFVALKTDRADGHDHVKAALAKGASGAIVQTSPGPGPFLVVDDTQDALGRMGAFGRARFTGKAIAVTGSVGKTTVKEMLRLMLAAQGQTHAAAASFNNHLGVPLTLALLPPAARYCVAEIGMNHPGEIAPLARLVQPHVALITTIEPAHIGNLGSIEAIADEKARIAAGLLPGGTLVLPADGPMAARLRERAGTAKILTHGRAASADARVLTEALDATGSAVTAQIGPHPINFRLNVPGAHMITCAIAALAGIHALGADVTAAARALAGFAAVTGRGATRRFPVKGGTAVLIDESYNASPASVRAALAVLGMQTGHRRVAVLGDMLELGDRHEADHQALADAVAANADRLYACGPGMKVLFDSIPAKLRGAHAADSAALAPLLRAGLLPNDAVLVKGSLGSRMKLVVTALESLA
jgi:UDP-N-acetylmuramoyl-tripeptide--D-alanyl-D-alanine ligase